MKVYYVEYNREKSLYFLFLLYLLMLVIMSYWGSEPTLLWLSEGTQPQERTANFIPFSSILTYLMNIHNYNFFTWFYDLFGNILAYIPLGFMIPLLLPSINRARQILILSLFPIVAIEGIQFLYNKGVFDVDDIMLNLLGTWIGFTIFVFMKKINLFGYFKR